MVIRLLNITDIRVRLLNLEDSNKKASVAITIDDCFAIHGFSVVAREDKLVVYMPSKSDKFGKRDQAHPLNTETRNDISDKILAAYEKAKAEANV